MATRYSNNERDNIFNQMQPPALLRRRFATACRHSFSGGARRSG